jgi:MarR family transcriptional regulator, organic hydroperoxide resistance regulator
MATGKKSVGGEAWELLADVFASNKPRLHAMGAEFDLAPMQAFALRKLSPGDELPMSALAEWLMCDASNVTGIVDRLEARGLTERRPAARDRRIKMIALTQQGIRVRERLIERFLEPPPEIAALPLSEQRALRDLLRKVVAAREGAAAPELKAAG